MTPHFWATHTQSQYIATTVFLLIYLIQYRPTNICVLQDTYTVHPRKISRNENTVS